MNKRGKPGRPIGWRKKAALRHPMMVRVSERMWCWISKEAKKAGLTGSEIVRQVLEDRMAGQ